MALHSISTWTSEISIYVLSFLAHNIDSKSFCLFDQFLQAHFLPLLPPDLCLSHNELRIILQNILAYFMPPGFPQLISIFSKSPCHFCVPGKNLCTFQDSVQGYIFCRAGSNCCFSVPQMNTCLPQNQYRFSAGIFCPGLSTLMDRGHVWFMFICTATSPRLALFAAKWKQWRWSLKSLIAATFHSLRKQSQISSTLNQHAGGSHWELPFPALKAWAAQVWTQHGVYCCHEYDTLFDWASFPVDSC